MGAGNADAEAGQAGATQAGQAGTRQAGSSATTDQPQGEGSDKPIQAWAVRYLPLVAFLTWELLLLMCLLFQYRSLTNFQSGDDSYRAWIMVAGGMGIVSSLSPLLALCDEDWKGAIWFTWIRSCGSDCPTRWSKLITGILHLLFFAAYCYIMSMASEKAAVITNVSQTLYLETNCQDSRILVVEERLTIGIQGSTISWVERNLPNQVEPVFLGFDNVQNISGLRVTNTMRKEAGKWDMYYETGQVTVVRLEFDRRRYGFDLQLRYRARLSGNGGCSDGSSVCPLTAKPGMVQFNAGWEVYAPYANVETRFAFAGCVNGTCGNWSFKTLPVGSEGLGLEVLLPAEVGVGTESCPLAWSLPGRNWFWCLGAFCLAAAAGVCMCGLATGEGKGILVAGGIASAFGFAAAVLFAMAFLF